MQEKSDDIMKRLKQLEGWELEDGGKIVKSYGFNSFMKAIDFVNGVAKIAEERNHHPIINISWKTVTIYSISLDVGRLTDRDFGLAKALDEMYKTKYQDKLSRGGDSMEEDEDRLWQEEEERERARLRTRGPYRKSSRAGLV